MTMPTQIPPQTHLREGDLFESHQLFENAKIAHCRDHSCIFFTEKSEKYMNMQDPCKPYKMQYFKCKTHPGESIRINLKKAGYDRGKYHVSKMKSFSTNGQPEAAERAADDTMSTPIINTLMQSPAQLGIQSEGRSVQVEQHTRYPESSNDSPASIISYTQVTQLFSPHTTHLQVNADNSSHSEVPYLNTHSSQNSPTVSQNSSVTSKLNYQTYVYNNSVTQPEPMHGLVDLNGISVVNMSSFEQIIYLNETLAENSPAQNNDNNNNQVKAILFLICINIVNCVSVVPRSGSCSFVLYRKVTNLDLCICMYS